MPMWTGVSPGLDRRRRLAFAIVTAVMAAAWQGGCTGSNPAYKRVDALGRPQGGNGPDMASGGAGGGGGAPAADGAADGTAGADLTLPPEAGAPDQQADSLVVPPDAPLPLDAPLPPDAPAPDLPAADRPPDAPPPATTRYNFEVSLQNWGDLRPGRPTPPVVSRVTAPAPAWDGQYALAVNLSSNATSTHSIVGIAQEFRSQLPPNTTIRFRLWLPAGDALEYLQPFVLYYKATDADGHPLWAGFDPPLFTADLARQQWISITHRVPANADSRGVVELGLEFVMRQSRSATVYVDGVDW
jgi:hypothetical protein